MSKAKCKLSFEHMTVIGISLIFLLSISSSRAIGQVTQFTAIDVTCEVVDEGRTSVDDEGVTHTEGRISKGLVMSDNPLMNGISYIVVDSKVEPESNITQLWVTSFVYPDSVNGTWVSPGQGRVSPDGLLVLHQGNGARDLENSFIIFEVRGAVVDPANLPCEPVIPPVELTGVIIGGSE